MSCPFLILFAALTKVVAITKNKFKNLLGGEATTPSSETAPTAKVEKKLVSHWKGNITINLVVDRTAFPRGGVPAQLAPCPLTSCESSPHPFPAHSCP